MARKKPIVRTVLKYLFSLAESSLPSQAQGSSMKKDFQAYELKADSKSDNLKLLEKALYSIPPTSVLSEREFSKSTHFLNPGRSLMTDEHLNDLCFLKDLFETAIKKH